MTRSGSERRNLGARVRNIRSQRAKGAVGRWQMKAWSGQKLLEEFSAMDTDKSNGVDQGELAVFLEPLNLGKLCPEDLQELFEFLDVDKDGIISVQDFSTAVVTPMQEEQMERAIDTKELGGLFADALPLPQIGEDGTMSNALEEVVELSALEIEKLLAQTIPKIAATIHSRLQPHRDALKRAKHVSQPGPTSTKFMFEYADVSQAEHGALSEQLGLPGSDVANAMVEEHASTEDWTTGNYGLTTNPKQELEFVNSPASGMLYPGEGPGGRRRQDAVAAWRSEHAELPVAEALKGFKSRLGKVDAEILTRQVASALARHGSEEDKDRVFAGELRRALVQSLFQPEEMDAHEAGEVAGNVEEEVFKTAAHGRWMGESERVEWVERQLKREVRELQEAIAAWDLSLVEVKAVMLYTGPLFEKYNAVLRKLGPRGEDVPFRTTILMLISAVMKMRKRTTLSGARKVYRGLKDGELPVTWVLEGRFGSKGGAERGFLSTSLSWEEAAKYAAWGSNPVLLEIDLGQIDKGADVSRLSQYPAEKEVLFPPMSNLEVLGMPRLETFNGRSIMVLSIRANVSLRNATREELQAKRKAVFLPSLTNIVQEIERDLDLIVSSGQPRSEALLECRFWVKETVMKNVQSLVAQYEARAPGWFQVDQHYQVAVEEAASLKRRAVAKMRSLWDAELSGRSEEVEVAKRAWEGKLLSVVHAEVLNDRMRRWEASRASLAAGHVCLDTVRADALALCEWRGLVDPSDVDMAMDLDGTTTLVLAALLGKTKDVQLLLDAGCSPHITTTRSAETALHKAAAEGHAEVLAVLLAANADPEAKNSRGDTALILASRKGLEGAVNALLDAGADVNCVDSDGRTPLSYCCETGLGGVVRRLVGNEATASVSDSYGRSPLVYACARGLEDVVLLLMDRMGDSKGAALLDCRDLYGKTPLLLACEQAMESAATRLIDAGARVGAADKGGRTPLSFASQAGLEGVATRLLAEGAEVNGTDSDGCSAHVYALLHGHSDLAKMLVSRGAEVNSKDLYLEKLERDWAARELSVREHSKAGVYVLVGVDELLVQLEDDHAALLTMRSSRFVLGLRDRIESWIAKFEQLRSVLEAWLALQRVWMALDATFAADIQDQLPAEARTFAEVDRTWTEALQRTKERPLVLEAAGVEGAREGFTQAEAVLEGVQQRVSEFLRTKRWSCPRFCFLSNADVLRMLSEAARDPALVLPHLEKLFDSLVSVDFKSALPGSSPSLPEDAGIGPEAAGAREEGSGAAPMLVAIKSVQGEHVPLSSPVSIAGKRVEVWICELVDAMRAALRDWTERAREAYTDAGRDEWLFAFPAQCVRLALEQRWTAQVEAALAMKQDGSDDALALQRILALAVAHIGKMAAFVRQDLTKLQRDVLLNLLVGAVQSRDVNQKLIADDVGDSTSFAWTSQLRFYWDQDQAESQAALHCCTVRQCSTSLWYQWEYLGASSRLVHTPLTDRCYIAMTGALRLDLCGQATGPAGTGKTETIKELGKALGAYVVVFNCSDAMDYLVVGKVLTGLAGSGAWGCFDEFNRISIEVLSVVGQQISTILRAVQAKQDQVQFEGAEIPLLRPFGCFVTMNPGSAGRTELPDSLKASFRSVSMMVPDLDLIIEILLLREGFEDAKVLSRKVAALYNLAKEQLAKKSHYDWGLRAITSVARSAGALKRADLFLPEDQVVISALRASTVPKLTTSDFAIMRAILGDLFPGSTENGIEHERLEECIGQHLRAHKLQALPLLVDKTVQLHEVVIARHGVMVLGAPCVGKSTCITMLGRAWTQLKEGGAAGFEKVDRVTLNPKSIRINELYGGFNEMTHEWIDGLLPVLCRRVCDAAANGGTDKTWICFDGPVDSLWIENMNSVLDDNKLLTLANNERIKLPQTLSMLFELADLDVATPATVSRCGIVLLDQVHLGWQDAARSWASHVMDQRFAGCGDTIMDMLEQVGDATLAFVRKECTEYIESVDFNLMRSCCNVMDSLLRSEHGVTHANVGLLVAKVFVFAYIWSLGANLHDASRKQFESFARSVIANLLPDFPSDLSIFDWKVDILAGNFVQWNPPEFTYNPSTSFRDLFVPTVESTRIHFLLRAHVAVGNHVLLGGGAGVGKSVMLHDFVEHAGERFVTHAKVFSARTSTATVKTLVEEKLERRSHAALGPPEGKTALFLVDDINMPAREDYGAQPPLELLRQIIDARDEHGGGLYDLRTKAWRRVENLVLLAAAAPPGGGRTPLPPRLLRHLHLINASENSIDDMRGIFVPIFAGFAASVPQLSAAFVGECVRAVVEVYVESRAALRPTPTKSHYIFNLRDVSKVIEGMMMVRVEDVNDEVQMIRLWCHENARVFRDRLCDDEDRRWFDEKLQTVLEQCFHCSREQIVLDDVLFGDFLVSKAGPYAEITDMEAAAEALGKYAKEYTAELQRPLDLVFFKNAILHISRITRVLRQARGHLLQVGVGGSGRHSLTRLASFVSGMKCFEIERSRGYGTEAFRSDLKRVLMQAGAERAPTVFLFSDAQLLSESESFLDEVSALIAGEIPEGLFLPAELAKINKLLGPIAETRSIAELRGGVYELFKELCRENLHVVLQLSPLEAKLRARFRAFPSFVNCCTVDWFSPWRDSALLSVAQHFLGRVGLESEREREAISQVCVTMHASVRASAASFLAQLRRHTYVTPRSYLELINMYSEMLVRERAARDAQMARYQGGLDALQSANSIVYSMQAELVVLQATLRQKAAQSSELSSRMPSGSASDAAAEAQSAPDVGRQALEEVGSEERVEAELVMSCQTREALASEAELAAKKLSMAEELMAWLRGEALRWEEALQSLVRDREALPGNILLAAGLVAYAGPFTRSFRHALVSEWAAACASGSIAVEPEFSLERVLGDPPTVRAWNVHGLPSDKISTENAIIVSQARRWPLMIDPQMQASQWVRAQHKAKVILLSDSSWLRVLETCIRTGTAVLLDCVGETLDPALEPVLAKQVVSDEGRLLIRLRDTAVDYDKDFRLYIASRLPNPHFAPEVCVKVTVVNFTVTADGLEDQLLSQVVAQERPELEEEKNQLVVQIGGEKKRLAELEDKILFLLGVSRGNILEDEVLVAALKASKASSQDVRHQLAQATDTQARIETACEGYKAVAKRGAILYFVIADLGSIDPMYQYSLQFFAELFGSSMKKCARGEGLRERVGIPILVKAVTEGLYSNVCRGLFEKDARTLSLLMATQVLRLEQHAISDPEWRLLLAAGDAVPEGALPRVSWITDTNLLARIANLEKIQGMSGIVESLETDAAAWQAWFSSRSPSSEALPARWEAATSVFQKLLVVRVLREDALGEAAKHLVLHTLGEPFVQPPPFDLVSSFLDSSPRIPIFFILSTGADPAADLFALADKLGQRQELKVVSLGQGQGPKAKQMVRESRERGNWVYLQNCHLGESWLPKLEELLVEHQAATLHPSSRLFLSSIPTPKFPASVLQASIKLTNEAPAGLRASLKRSYESMAPAGAARFEGGEKERAWQKLLFALALFHHLVLERRSYGAIGWNNRYEWNQLDLHAAQSNVAVYLGEHAHDQVPYATLQYVIGDIIYGGCVTDSLDKRCLSALLRRCFASAADDSRSHSLSDDSQYRVPEPTDLASVRAYIHQLPMEDRPEAFGLHRNTAIARDMAASRRLLDAIIAVQPRSSAGSEASESATRVVAAVVKQLSHRVPPPLLSSELSSTAADSDRQYPAATDALATCLELEARRFDALLSAIRSSLANLHRAIEGLVVMSEELDEMHQALLFHRVPMLWTRVCYLSLKPLGPWFEDLLARVAFVRRWIQTGPPASFWASAFFLPTGFLTAVLQAHARTHHIAIDSLSFRATVMSADAWPAEAQGPAQGVYIHGLFLEGARWDAGQGCLAESHDGSSTASMPTIWLDPAVESAMSHQPEQHYSCPWYSTSARRGANKYGQNHVQELLLAGGEREPEHWVLRGVALLSQLDA